MASNIDPAVPPFGTPTTAGVRQNFQNAKDEIEAIQSFWGWQDYNDTATAGAPISIPVSTWTKLTNDGLGSNTNDSFLPSGITDTWDTSTNQFDFTEVPIGSKLFIRYDYTITTTAVNQAVRTRISFAIGGASPFQLFDNQEQFKTAGSYRMTGTISPTIRNTNSGDNPAEIQVFSDAAASVVVSGWEITILKWML